ncbi:MAG: transcriptional regulator BetI [Silicimonas sp.]|nr:transcriptional regulator BetI [Silicimonas sp.]
MEPIRRAALIDAAIAEIGAVGSLDVTVSRIARRAGMSSGLAHHYFGGKEDILLAAMRHVLRIYGHEVLKGLRAAARPVDRVTAIVQGSFAPSNFRADTVAAWLNFYVLALSSDEARRLHAVYRRRLLSNLTHALRPVAGHQAAALAARTAALIDGLYLDHGLANREPDGASATAQVLDMLADATGRAEWSRKTT